MMKKGMSQRTCVGCRKVTDQEHLIRIVSSPEGLLIPDLKAKLPGRGAYVCSHSPCIRKATRKGVLSRSLKRPIEASELSGLEKKVDEALDRKIFSFLSVLMKGKKIVIGRESIRESLRRGKIHLLLRAADARDAQSGSSKANVTVRVLSSRGRLGDCIGKAPQPAVGILDARGGQELLRMIDMKNGLELGGGE